MTNYSTAECHHIDKKTGKTCKRRPYEHGIDRSHPDIVTHHSFILLDK